jgi:hypothetical protein
MAGRASDTTNWTSGFLVPVAAQWWPRRSLRPEQRLMCAVLEESLTELAATRVAARSRLEGHPHRDELLAWFASPDRSWPFSFENICDAIDLDPGQVRAGLRILSRSSTRWL